MLILTIVSKTILQLGVMDGKFYPWELIRTSLCIFWVSSALRSSLQSCALSRGRGRIDFGFLEAAWPASDHKFNWKSSTSLRLRANFIFILIFSLSLVCLLAYFWLGTNYSTMSLFSHIYDIERIEEFFNEG